MKIFTTRFLDGKGAVFQIVALDNTEETLLDACVTSDINDGEANLIHDGVKKFKLTLPVFNGGSL